MSEARLWGVIPAGGYFLVADGGWSLVGRFCAHRGVDLAYGRHEDGGLRCLYHGWLYGPDGRCLEQPAEPPHSTSPAANSPS